HVTGVQTCALPIWGADGRPPSHCVRPRSSRPEPDDDEPACSRLPTESTSMKQLHGIGKPVRRKEDRRFVTGRGQYTADITLPGQLHLAVCRSPQAHARIRSIDISAAATAEGVVAVLTAADLETLGIACIPCVWPLVDAAGKAMFEPPHP